MRARAVPLFLAVSLTACTEAAPEGAPVPAPPQTPVTVTVTPTGSPAGHARIDGQSFPDKVISLTFDDGPDASTLDLAGYLKSRRISATFFVVASWIAGLSDEPGHGKGVYESGYDYLPILGDLVGLGHRLGNHTLNHVVLREAAGTQMVDHELRENQHNLDPFLTNELRLFRAPGGGWGSFAAGIVEGDPYLTRMVGPIAWDIDRKDWDESLGCIGPRGAFECEHAAPGGALRMKPSAVAARYLAAIESKGHGIVLLHDRVGHVGSRYALEVAQALIPQLEGRGFVFAAPVLRFAPLTVRHREADVSDAQRWDESSLRIGDVNGDGREDVCGRTVASGAVTCAVSVQIASKREDRLPHAAFRTVKTARTGAAPGGRIHLADVTADGQADVCVAGLEGISCAASNATGELGAFHTWSRDDHAASFRFADIDGDGKADACSRTEAGISCARNTGRRFEATRVWLADTSLPRGGAVELADVDGDGRADVCARSASGVLCALSNGRGFGKLEAWAPATDFTYDDLRFGDLNGDGRDDVCGRGRDGIVCALSNGRRFARATVWLEAEAAARLVSHAAWQLGDVNGDGRVDLCGRSPVGMVCGLAP